MIKIEFDLPEFEKELTISVTLKKDGEVITTSSSSPGVQTEISTPVWKQSEVEEKVVVSPEEKPKKSTKKKTIGGNMMDLDF